MNSPADGAANLLHAKAARGRGRKKARSGRSPFSARKVAIFLLFLFIALAGGLGFFVSPDQGQIADGVTINSLEVGGKTPEEAKALLQKTVADLRLTFENDGQKLAVPVDLPVKVDGQPLASFNINAAVDQAAALGRGADALTAAVERLDAYLFGANIEMPITLDLDGLKKVVNDKFGALAGPAENARFLIRTQADGGRPYIGVIPEKEGVVIDQEFAAKQTAERLQSLSAAPIGIRLKRDRPTLTIDDLNPLVPAAEAALARAPLALKAKTLTWEATQVQIADWLTAAPSGEFGTKAKLDLDAAALGKYLASHTAKVAAGPVDAVFEMKDNKVTAFSPSSDGEGVDVESALGLLRTALFGEMNAAAPAIELPFKTLPPAIDTEQANPYGIKEIIGVGESNFKNSPKNRRANIKVGADSVNGTIIPADTEYSLLKTLGPVDEDHGYLKELVIKKDKTQPEYGGGLCQIGTTTFRAALAAGLPITERRNHSYRVPYYERDGSGKMVGPGKDATIYDPWPDLKFKNDTGHAILIMTEIKGDRLTFTFWGVSDGRKAEQTDAVVSNEVPPPPKQTVETTDLKPGETKCTETAHAGADAVFTYTVTYADGTVKKKNFYSHYKPWGEVCLIGVDPNAQPAAGSGALPSADVVGASGQ